MYTSYRHSSRTIQQYLPIINCVYLTMRFYTQTEAMRSFIFIDWRYMANAIFIKAKSIVTATFCKQPNRTSLCVLLRETEPRFHLWSLGTYNISCSDIYWYIYLTPRTEDIAYKHLRKLCEIHVWFCSSCLVVRMWNRNSSTVRFSYKNPILWLWL